jgi:hypothetical protein
MVLYACLDGEGRVSEGETTKLSGLGNYSPSLEIPGQILRVLE